jgi:hypothetical protein
MRKTKLHKKQKQRKNHGKTTIQKQTVQQYSENMPPNTNTNKTPKTNKNKTKCDFRNKHREILKRIQ